MHMYLCMSTYPHTKHIYMHATLYIYVCIHTCMSAFIHVCMLTYIHIYRVMDICECTCTCIYIHGVSCLPNTDTHVCLQTCIHIYISVKHFNLEIQFQSEVFVQFSDMHVSRISILLEIKKFFKYVN